MNAYVRVRVIITRLSHDTHVQTKLPNVTAIRVMVKKGRANVLDAIETIYQ